MYWLFKKNVPKLFLNSWGMFKQEGQPGMVVNGHKKAADHHQSTAQVQHRLAAFSMFTFCNYRNLQEDRSYGDTNHASNIRAPGAIGVTAYYWQA